MAAEHDPSVVKFTKLSPDAGMPRNHRAYFRGVKARKEGAQRLSPPDELDPEAWLVGYDSTPSDFDGSPPMPGELHTPISRSSLPLVQAPAGYESGISQPVTPDWAKEIHPNSFLAPEYVLSDQNAEQLLQVWRHNDRMTIVVNPEWRERDDEETLLIKDQLAMVLISIHKSSGRPPQVVTEPLIADGIPVSLLKRHLERVAVSGSTGTHPSDASPVAARSSPSTDGVGLAGPGGRTNFASQIDEF